MFSSLAFLTSLNWASPTWDAFIFFFFAVGALLYGLTLGRERVMTILFSMYMSLAVASNAPILDPSSAMIHAFSGSQFLRIGVFVVIFILAFLFLSRSAHFMAIRGWRPAEQFIEVAIFSILQVGLLISVTLNLLPPVMVQGLTGLTKEVFMSAPGRSVWLILPLLLMVLAPKAS